MSQLNDLLVFWYGSIPEGSEHHDMEYVMKWFTGGEQADNEIRERFTDLFEQAKRGELDDWANESTFHKLGLIILFDQFTRSQHRGSSEAFAYDSRALDLAKSIYPSETFDQLPSMCKLTVLLPFCHSENLQDQETLLAEGQRQIDFYQDEKLKQIWAHTKNFFEQHKDQIQLFGRFPFRNQALGRETTPDEEEFMKNHKPF